MRTHRTASRRSFLAGAGAAVVAAVAGCQGDSDDEGENSPRGTEESGTQNGDSSNTSEPQSRGELIHTESISDKTTDWEYELEEGETITVVAEGENEDTFISGDIVNEETREGGNLATINGAGQASMQHTVEQAATYKVSVKFEDSESGSIEIYIAEI